MIEELENIIAYLTLSHSYKTWFLCVCSTCLLKTLWEKEKMLVTSIFSFSHSVFYPIKNRNHYFTNILLIVVCKCFEFGQSKKKNVVWERVNTLPNHKTLDTSKSKTFEQTSK